MRDYTQQLEKEKLEEMREIVITITGYMVLPLYLIFWITDIVYAPEFAWEFLFLRCLVIPIALTANYYIRKATTLKYAQNVSLTYVISLAAIINIMMIMMANPTSAYYTGLILITIGALGFFPWTRNYFILVVIGIFLPYVAIVYSLNPTKEDIVDLVVYGFFANGTVTILWVIQFFRERLRIKEVSARLELNAEIEKRKTVENDLILARDQALQASQAKSAFLANMSHELRTPLNAIIGYSELLQETAVDDGNDEYVNDLTKIDAAGKNLLELINGVLDISKIEAGQMEVSIEQFNLQEMLQNVEVILAPIFNKNNNQFILEYDPDVNIIKSDETKLRQVIYNLASNAGKFTKDGVISLKVSKISIYDKSWLRFDMTDSGLGMTVEQVTKVFNAFTQADSSTTKKFGGTGLGLSICKHFCEMLGGDIFLKSELNIGSTFSVLIPCQLDKDKNLVDADVLENVLLKEYT